MQCNAESSWLPCTIFSLSCYCVEACYAANCFDSFNVLLHNMCLFFCHFFVWGVLPHLCLHIGQFPRLLCSLAEQVRSNFNHRCRMVLDRSLLQLDDVLLHAVLYVVLQLEKRTDSELKTPKDDRCLTFAVFRFTQILSLC